MPINPNIALSFQPARFESPVNQMAQVLQIRGMQDEQAMNRLKVDEYRRGIADQEALRSALSQPGADPYQVLLQRGNVKGAMDWQKGQQDIAKTRGEVDAKAVETAHKRIDGWGQAMGFVRQNPTPENAMAAVQFLVNMGIMPKEQAQAALSGVDGSPESISRWADMGFRTALSAKDQLPKIQTNNIGGQTVTQSIDPLTGRPTMTGAIQNTVSPDAVMTDNRVRSEGAANRQVTMRGQDLVSDRTREANNIAAQGNVVKTETDLRKEFADLPEVKRYKAAYPSYAAIESAAKTNNRQADINLIYGLAKLYDPDSVVREGEYNTIANSQAIPDWVKGAAQSLIGGGKLTDNTRQQILAQARGRISTFQAEHDKARATYDQIARQRGGRPENVFTPIGAPVSAEPKVIDFGSLP